MTTATNAPDPTPNAAGARRGLALAAVSALLIAAVAACGSDTDGDTTATDPAPSTSQSAPSASSSTSASPSDAASASASTSGDPVPSPVIDEAVGPALAAGFPALVPAGVPAGWTVVSAAYAGQEGGRWTIELTDPSGAPVRLVQAAQGLRAFVAANVEAGVDQSGDVDLGEYGTGAWTVYSGAAQTAIVTEIAGTSAMVAGPDQDTVVALAELLLTAEDGGSGSGDG